MFLESCCFSPHNVPKGEKKCYIMLNELNGLYHVPQCIINSLCLFHLKLLSTHWKVDKYTHLLFLYQIKTFLALLSLLDHMGVLHLHSRNHCFKYDTKISHFLVDILTFRVSFAHSVGQ